jgi:hypothetical protein
VSGMEYPANNTKSVVCRVRQCNSASWASITLIVPQSMRAARTHDWLTYIPRHEAIPWVAKPVRQVCRQVAHTTSITNPMPVVHTDPESNLELKKSVCLWSAIAGPELYLLNTNPSRMPPLLTGSATMIESGSDLCGRGTHVSVGSRALLSNPAENPFAP